MTETFIRKYFLPTCNNIGMQQRIITVEHLLQRMGWENVCLIKKKATQAGTINSPYFYQ